MENYMSFLKKLFALFSRKNTWDSMNYGQPATVEDELSRLNNER
jgi:hypothetical protein